MRTRGILFVLVFGALTLYAESGSAVHSPQTKLHTVYGHHLLHGPVAIRVHEDDVTARHWDSRVQCGFMGDGCGKTNH